MTWEITNNNQFKSTSFSVNIHPSLAYVENITLCASAAIESHVLLSLTVLWPPKARPLYFTAVIYFYFVSIDERPAMGSEPNLASNLVVVSIYKCPRKLSGAFLQNLWRKKTSNFGPLFPLLPHLTPHISGKTSHGQTKILVSIYNVSPTWWPTFRDL